jgi:glycosyltransferase involved in cell wall biosynthesis
LPSYFEGQPLTMLEAAAMGLAILTTNICGMADFIENGINVSPCQLVMSKPLLRD